ncbi:unnamed protein product [Auanema sp. JU1783]|nr:unnamed protein product [Auanema sp. JU1783]
MSNHYKKLTLLNKMDIVCELNDGSFMERMEMLDRIEKYYDPDVFQNDNLMRRLILPVIATEFLKPHSECWKVTLMLRSQRNALCWITAFLVPLFAAAVFWTFRTRES